MCLCASYAAAGSSDVSKIEDRSSFKPIISNSTRCDQHLFQNETNHNRADFILETKAKSIKNLPTVESSNLTYQFNHTFDESDDEKGRRKDLIDLDLDEYELRDDRVSNKSQAKYTHSAISSASSKPHRQLNGQDTAEVNGITLSTTLGPTLKQLFDDDEDLDMVVSQNLPPQANNGTSKETEFGLGFDESKKRPKGRINSKAGSYSEPFQYRSGFDMHPDRGTKLDAKSKHLSAPMFRVVSSNLSPKHSSLGQEAHQLSKLVNELDNVELMSHLAANKNLTRDKNYEASKRATILKFATFPQIHLDAIKKGTSYKNRLILGNGQSIFGKNMNREQYPEFVQDSFEQQVVGSPRRAGEPPYRTLTASLIPVSAHSAADKSTELEEELSPFDKGFHSGYWQTNNNNSYNKENDHSLWSSTTNSRRANGSNSKSNSYDYNSVNNYPSRKTTKFGDNSRTNSQPLKPILLKSDVKVRSELVFENNNSNSGIDGLADKKLSGSVSKQQTNLSAIRRLDATTNSNDNSTLTRISFPAPILFNMNDEKLSDDESDHPIYSSPYKTYYQSNDSNSSLESKPLTSSIDEELVKSFDHLSNVRVRNNVGDYELLSKRDEADEGSFNLENKSNSWPYANYVAKPKAVLTKTNTASSGIRVTTGEGPTPLIINNNGLIVAAKHNATGKPYNSLSLTNQLAEHSLNPIRINGNLNVHDDYYSLINDNRIERPTFLKKPLIISDTLWTRNSTSRPELIKQTSYNLLSSIQQPSSSQDKDKHSFNDIYEDTSQPGDQLDIDSLMLKQHLLDKRYPNRTHAANQSLSFHHNPPYKHHLSSLNQRPANSNASQSQNLISYNSQANCTTNNQNTTTLAPISLSNAPKQNTRHPDQIRIRTSPSPNQSTDRISYELSTSQSQHQSNRFPSNSTSSIVNEMSSTTPLYESSSQSSTTSSPIEYSSSSSSSNSSTNHSHKAGGHGHSTSAQHHHHAMTQPTISAHQNSHPHFSSTNSNLISNITPSVSNIKPSKIRNKLQHIIIGKILKSQLNNSLTTNGVSGLAGASFNQQMAASQQYPLYQAPSTPPPLLSSTVANNVANLLAQKLNSFVRPYQPLSGLNSLLGIRAGSGYSSQQPPSLAQSQQTNVINRFKQRINPFNTQTAHSGINRRTTGVGSLLMSGFVYGLTVLPALMALTGINPLSGAGGVSSDLGAAAESSASNGPLSIVTNRHGVSEKKSKRLKKNNILSPLLADTDPLSSYAYLVPLVTSPAAPLTEESTSHLSSETLPHLSEPQQQSNIINTIHVPPNGAPLGSNSLASNLFNDIHPLLDDPNISHLSPTAAPIRLANHHLATFSSSLPALHGSNSVAHYMPSASNLWLERVAPANRKHFQDSYGDNSNNNNHNHHGQQQATMDNFARSYNLSGIRKAFGYGGGAAAAADIIIPNQYNLYNLGSSISQEKQVFGGGDSNRISGNLIDNQNYLIENDNNNNNQKQQDNSNSNSNSNTDNEIRQTASAPRASEQQQQLNTINHISMSPTTLLSSLLFANSQVSPPIRSPETLSQRQQLLLGSNDHYHDQNHLSSKRQADENYQEHTNLPTNSHLKSISSKLEHQLQQRYQASNGADNIVQDPYSNSIEGNTISAMNSIDNYINSHRRRRTPSNFVTTFHPSSGETELKPVIVTRPIKRPPHLHNQFLSAPVSTSVTVTDLYAPTTKAKPAKEKITQDRPDSLSQLLANDRYPVSHTLNHTPIAQSSPTQMGPAAINTFTKHQSNYLVPIVPQNIDSESNNKNWRAITPTTSQISTAKDAQFHLFPNSLKFSLVSKDQHRDNLQTASGNHWLVTGTTSQKNLKPNLKITKLGILKPGQEKKRKRKKQSQTTTELPIEDIQDREGESRLVLSHAMAMGSKVLNDPVVDDLQR